MASFKAEVTVDEQGVQFGKNYGVSQEAIVGNLSPKFFLEWREDQRKKAERAAQSGGDRHRGTGRTTRMLKYALEQMKEGKSVGVVGWGKFGALKLMEAFETLALPSAALARTRYNGFHFQYSTRGCIAFFSGERYLQGERFDEILYDHYTIEQSINEAVAEMHRWDEGASRKEDAPSVPEEEKKPRDPFELAMEMLNSGQITFIKKESK